MAPWRSRTLPIRLGVAAIAVVAASLPALDAGASAKAAAAPQLGINSYMQDLCQSNSVWASDAKGQFTEFKSLGANSVAIAFPIYSGGIKSNTLFVRRVCGTNYQTPSTARLTVAIKEAHALHLKVLLRPLIDEINLQKQGGWRGALKPTNVAAWFKSYLATMTPYLKLAKSLKVEGFAIATELDSLAKKTNWTSLIKSAKKDFGGTMSFSIDWAETAAGKVGHTGTAPGMDAYQNAALPNTATPSQLLASWNNAAASTDKVPFSLSTATITEVGILAQDGAYSEPYAWTLPLATHPFDPTIQANWFSMACSFFKAHKMKGIYYWGVWYATGAHAVLTAPSASYPQEIQPASAAVIKACFK